MRARVCFVSVALASFGLAGAAAAEPAGAPGRGKVSLTPYLGVMSQSDYYDDFVLFIGEDREYLLIEPDTAVAIGIDVAYAFTTKLAGYLQLSYASADARYIENDNFRPDVDLDTTRIEAGARYTLVTFGAKQAPLYAGGGLSLSSHSIENMVWSGRAVEPSATSLGVHGLLGVDVPVSDRVSLRGALKLSYTPLDLDELENDLAQAEGELADVQEETSRVVELQFGVTVYL